MRILKGINQVMEYYYEKANSYGFSSDDIEFVRRGVKECVKHGVMEKLNHDGGSPLLKIIWANHILMQVLKSVDGIIQIEE